jgi:hypothetical protein
MSSVDGRRIGQWIAVGVGLLALGHVASAAWPRENRFVIGLPVESQVRSVTLELSDSHGELLRTASFRVENPAARRLEYVVKVSPGTYDVSLGYEIRAADLYDKNHWVDWTWVGSRHHIRLEGEDYRFPPPHHEAK